MLLESKILVAVCSCGLKNNYFKYSLKVNK